MFNINQIALYQQLRFEGKNPTPKRDFRCCGGCGLVFCRILPLFTSRVGRVLYDLSIPPSLRRAKIRILALILSDVALELVSQFCPLPDARVMYLTGVRLF
jgi:hypothetical protein